MLISIYTFKELQPWISLQMRATNVKEMKTVTVKNYKVMTPRRSAAPILERITFVG